MTEFIGHFAAFLTDLEAETGTHIPQASRRKLARSFAHHGGTYSPYLTSARMAELEAIPKALPTGDTDTIDGTAVEEPAQIERVVRQGHEWN